MNVIELFILSSAIALSAGLSFNFLRVKLRAKREESLIEEIAATITAYFLNSHVTVEAHCIAQPLEKHYLVFLDSAPHKNFRYSHIVETVLAQHIQKTMGVSIDRVYWRFPLPTETKAPAPLNAVSTSISTSGQKPVQDESPLATTSPVTQEDEYLTKGLVRAKAKDEYKVDEGSWATFVEAMQHDNHEIPEKPAETLEENDQKTP